MAVVIGALWFLDVYAFNGRYSEAIWQDASAQGQRFSDQIQRWLNNGLGPSR